MIRSIPFGLVLVCAAISFAQSPDLRPSKVSPSPHSGPPIMGEFQRNNQLEAASDQVRRPLREEKYGKLLLTPLTDPGKLADGQAESTNLTYINYVAVNDKDPHGIPASRSNAVVVATILSGKCYINSNHDYVYTDYNIRIDQILKQDTATILTVGSQAVASKPGGAIHFPSGHVTRVFISGHGLPAVGSQYILFLSKSNPNFPEYDMVFASGYELKNNHVFPLDNMNSEYENMAASQFIDLTKQAIAASGGQS